MSELTEFINDLMSDVDTAEAIYFCMNKVPIQMKLMMTSIVVIGLVAATLRLIYDAL